MVGFLLDLEGTLVKDKSYTPIPEALEFVKELEERKIPWLVATNNSTEKPTVLAEILREKGFPVTREKILSPSLLASLFLKREGVKSIYFLGTDKVKEFFREEGFEVREDHKVDAVVVGRDREINYGKLKTATSAVVKNGAKLFSFHMNRLILDPDGLVGPSVGAIATAISYASNRSVTSFGKPSKEYFKKAFELLGISDPKKVYMVSDDPFTDLAEGKKVAGFKTVFVLSGKYPTQEVLAEIPKELHPDYVFPHAGYCRELVNG